MPRRRVFCTDGDVPSAWGFPLVEFDRRPVDPDLLNGWVLEWNSEFTLVQVIEGNKFQLDGYSVFRNSDVKRWRAVEASEFLARAAKLNGLQPRFPPTRVRVGKLAEISFTNCEGVPVVRAQPRETRQNGVRSWQGSAGESAVFNHSSYLSSSRGGRSRSRSTCKDITLLEFGSAYVSLLAKWRRRCLSSSIFASSIFASASKRSASRKTRTLSAND